MASGYCNLIDGWFDSGGLIYSDVVPHTITRINVVACAEFDSCNHHRIRTSPGFRVIANASELWNLDEAETARSELQFRA